MYEVENIKHELDEWRVKFVTAVRVASRCIEHIFISSKYFSQAVKMLASKMDHLESLTQSEPSETLAALDEDLQLERR